MKTILKPKSVCYGLTNKTVDGLFVLFADYDKSYLHILISDLNNLIKRFPNDFTNFAVFESTESQCTKNGTIGSYHVINFSKFPYQIMRERLGYLSVDDKFFELPAKTPYKANTLRVSPKFKWYKEGHFLNEEVLKEAPKFSFFYPSVEKLTPKKNKVSTAHLNAYQVLCGMPKFRFSWAKQEDKETFVQLKKYESASE